MRCVAIALGLLSAALAGEVRAANVVLNPGFETCDVQSKPVDWGAVGAETVTCGTANPHAGTSYLSVTNAAGLAQVESACVTVPPGAAVAPLQFAYRTSAATVIQVALTMKLFSGADCTGDAGSDPIGVGFNFGGGLSTDGDWHVVAGDAAAIGSDAHSARFVVSFQVNPTSPLVVDFDDVSYDPGSPATTTSTTIVTTTTSTTLVGSTSTTTTTATTSTTTTTVLVPLAAHLAVTPKPTCTGTPTVLDASGSTSPNGPIVRYRFTYEQSIGTIGATIDVPVELADGPDAAITHAFGWDHVGPGSCDLAVPPFVQVPRATRSDQLVTLTITDTTGAQATTSEMVTFAVHDSCSSRSACPGEGTFDPDETFVVPRVPAGASLAQVLVSRHTPATEVRVPIDCVLLGGCIGSVIVQPPLRRPSGLRTYAAAAAKTAAPIAEGDFAVGDPSTTEIAIPLTEAGKKLFRHKGKVKATVTVLAPGPSGTPYTSAVTVKVKKVRQRRP